MAGYSVTFSVVDQATRQLDQINRRITQMRAPLERMAKTTSKFIDVSGLKKISDGFQWIARSAGSALSVLTGVVPVLGVLTSAATIAGMTKLVGTFANWGNQLRTNADQIGITAQQLQLWEDATQRAGGSAADMTETLKNLHKISADAFTGMDNEALSYFRRFNISLTDANGKLRSATDLLPEVFRALDSLKDPADRARVAAALLGDSQAKLYEEYKQSGQPLEHWLDLERQHKQLTDDQLNALNQYRLAQAGLGTTFENLGRQISVVLATHFTPLLQHLDEFVQKHQPQIIAAIDHLATKFAEWLDNITWDDVENGLTRVCSALVWVSNHLDDIARVAEAIAALFAVKWAVNIVSAIATVTSALGSLGAGAAGAVGAAGGVGLLGALGAVATIAGLLAAGAGAGAKNVPMVDDYGRKTGTWGGRPEDEPQSNVAPENLITGKTIFQHLWDRIWNGPAALRPQRPGPRPENLPGGAPTDLGLGPGGPAPPSLAELPGDYSWGDFGTRANNPGNLNFASWENASGRYNYIDPHTGGQHTMAVFNTMQEGIAAQIKLLQNNQQKYGQTIAGALHGYAENPYIGKLGVDPNQQFDIAHADPETLAKVLEAQYKLEGRKGSHTATHEQILAGIALSRGDTEVAAAPPSDAGKFLAGHFAGAPAAPPPAANVNGSVTVDVGFRNAPPNATVTARGSGAVDVPPPRIEHPQVDFGAAA